MKRWGKDKDVADMRKRTAQAEREAQENRERIRADFEGDDGSEDEDAKPEDLLGEDADGPDDDLIQRF